MLMLRVTLMFRKLKAWPRTPSTRNGNCRFWKPAGVLAGWSQLGSRKGIHFVEDLDSPEFVRVASEVLGAPVSVHDASAAPTQLADRRVTAAPG